MMELLFGLLEETWRLLEEMAPYLLFGFLIAGILHVLLPKEKVAKHLADRKFSSLLKATVFGIPLPICSCGVVPVAAHLQKQGAKRGPILAFLISTPTTGVDSILATYSLLGPLLAIMRPIAALFNGLLTGIVANFSLRKQPEASADQAQLSAIVEPSDGTNNSNNTNFTELTRKMFNYSFGELIEDIAKWLIIGIVVGGVISYFIPAELVERFLGNPILAYLVMLLIGIPMYVCATGSIPIAASLILKGLSPGAGFVFLFAGPATNTATLSFVGGKMGRKTLVIYLITILFSGLLFGGIIDMIWHISDQNILLVGGHVEILPDWLNTASAVVLIVLLLRPLLSRFGDQAKQATMTVEGLQFTVPDMNCEHCKNAVTTAVSKVDGVKDVVIDLKNRQVNVIGNSSWERIVAAIRDAGYHIKDGDYP